jgi:hypothetical protein
VDKSPKYDSVYGNSTQDKLFVLSISEAEKYFSSNEKREADFTTYAKSSIMSCR